MTTKTTDFVLYTRICDYDKYVRKYIVPLIPSVHRDIRIGLLDQISRLLNNLFYAEYTKENIRIKYITEMIVSISMLNYYTDLLLEELPVYINMIKLSIIGV